MKVNGLVMVEGAGKWQKGSGIEKWALVDPLVLISRGNSQEHR